MDDQRWPAAPPQYSMDGRWWWDGQRWVPVAPVARPRRPRSRAPLWVAVAALLIAAIGLTVLAGTTTLFPPGLRSLILGGGGGPAPVTYIATAPPPGADAVPDADAAAPPAGAALDQAAVAARVVPATVNLTIELHYGQGEAGGSGIVLTSTGLVLTDEHVTFQADSITAQVAGRGRSYDAAIVGADAADDVALIQLRGASGLTTATFGDPATARVGDAVMGIGYPDPGAPVQVRGRITNLRASVSTAPLGEQPAADYTNMLASSAATRPGMSGGPVVDSASRVVGVIESGDPGRTAAVRTDVALGIAKRIAAGRADARIVIGLPAILGAAADDARDDSGRPSGARITRVHANTPAQAAGLHVTYIVTKLGATAIATALDLELALVPHRPGDRVAISWSDTFGLPHHGTVTLARGPGP